MEERGAQGFFLTNAGAERWGETQPEHSCYIIDSRLDGLICRCTEMLFSIWFQNARNRFIYAWTVFAEFLSTFGYLLFIAYNLMGNSLMYVLFVIMGNLNYRSVFVISWVYASIRRQEHCLQSRMSSVAISALILPLDSLRG